jgi:hypothetical protein
VWAGLAGVLPRLLDIPVTPRVGQNPLYTALVIWRILSILEPDCMQARETLHLGNIICLHPTAWSPGTPTEHGQSAHPSEGMKAEIPSEAQ